MVRVIQHHQQRSVGLRHHVQHDALDQIVRGVQVVVAHVELETKV
jgi:ABC-type uncharacterized transport system substrate-binding protein